MAKTILPIAGAVVGAFFGAPQIGFAIGSLIAGAIPGEAQGPRIGETGAQTSQEGAPRAIIYGTAMCSGNVIASGPLIKRDVEENQGGKGGTDVSSEHAYRTFAVRVCEGPVTAFLRIWEDDKLVYDIRPGSSLAVESGRWAVNKVFYFGGEEQLPDPALQMIFGVDSVPAHRGSAYMVAIESDLTDRRGSIPQYRFEVSQSGDPAWDYSWSSIPFPDGLVGSGLVVRDDGMMYAATHSGAIYGSSDGERWTPESGTAPSGRCLIYSPSLGRAVAPAGDFGTAKISYTDGGLWISFKPEPEDSLTGVTQDWSGGCWAGGNFIAVSSSAGGTGVGTATSPSGLKWTTADPGTIGWASVDYSPALGIAVACRGEALGISVNGGTSWSTASFPGVQFNTVRWIEELALFIAVADGDVYWSSTATGWTAATWEGALPSKITGMAWSPGRRTLVSLERGTSVNTSTAVSQDGKVWRLEPAGISFPTVNFWPNTIVWNAQLGKFYALANDQIFVSGTVSATGTPVPLSEIVSDIHARCDFPEGKFDVAELEDMVTGLVLAGEYSGADAINTLRSLYLFDRSDFDKKIHYPKRGAAVVATLTYDDLVEEPDTSRREQAIEYPKKLHLGYQNAVGGYAVAKATSSRSSPDVRVVGETTMQVPVVLNPDQAAQAAAILHKVAYAEAEGEVKLSVPDSFLRFVPSNCIGLALRGRVNRLRIEQMDVAAGIIELTLRHDRQSAYTSTVTGVPIPAPTPPPPTIVGDSVLAVIDISARIDSEDDLHYLVAATGGMPAWSGATVQRSLDGGANYTNAASVGRGVVMGSLVNDLPSASELFTDTTNVIRVQLFRDSQTIEELTEQQFLTEGGAFVLMRPDGSSEVLQYRDAAQVSTGIYDLSHLHRGQLNSGASAHLAGALLVMLSRAVHVDAQSAWIGADLTHRAVSNGESPELAVEQTETFTAKSQTEWPVAYLALARSGGAVSATWTPRHRFGSDDAPVASINFQGYRVTLDDGVLAPVVFDTPTAAFSTDASALGSPLTVSVSALNRITGPGPSTSGAI